ncbi:MAG TPA: MFS transporter [Deltaproteobacteria bacterium]|nr:MFS transporter [Deltaproteobacteria bacterium]
MHKYLILIAAVFINLCLGAGYSWSTFVPALKETLGFSTAQAQSVFGIGALAATFMIFIGGRVQDRLGPRIPALIGGIIFGSSYILVGYSSGSYAALLVLIGVLAPAGVGLAYLCPIACSMKWFPNHKSLVTGITVAGFGGSAMIISQLGEYLLSQQVNVLTIFKYMGFGFTAVLIIATMFLKNPALIPENDAPVANTKISVIIRERKFLGLLCGIFPCFCAGLMVIGNIKPFGLAMNLEATAAGAAVTIIALFNTAGRLTWGFIGSIMEGKKVILISIISTAVVILAAPFVIKNNVTFYVFTVLAGFNFSACFVLYAAEIANQYGADKIGTVYSTLFLSNGIAGFIAPTLAGRIFDSTGSYLPAFMIFGLLAFAAIFMFYFIYKPTKTEKLEPGLIAPRL